MRADPCFDAPNIWPHHNLIQNNHTTTLHLMIPWPCPLPSFLMTTTLHRHNVLPLGYKFSKWLSSIAPLHQLIHHQQSIITSIAHFSEFLAEKQDPEPTMVSTKRLAQLAKKWQRMATIKRKRLSQRR
ncbi:hypothetical protein VPH35_099318 [Triticum aestivum]|uniref:Uncharacterized protein n=2 Tax=Aegilops tauschii subsp. strangulata TaxID=200361 RepID=A0A453LJ32_AEGTS